jgi:hypothetical protein
MNIHQQLEANQSRRMKAQDRALSRLEKREDTAERMIGELSSGAFYVYPVGGKYKESRNYGELIRYLIRNNYA